MSKHKQMQDLRQQIAALNQEKKTKLEEIKAIQDTMAQGKIRGDEAIRILDRKKRIKELEKHIPKLFQNLKQQEISKQKPLFN